MIIIKYRKIFFRHFIFWGIVFGAVFGGGVFFQNAWGGFRGHDMISLLLIPLFLTALIVLVFALITTIIHKKILKSRLKNFHKYNQKIEGVLVTKRLLLLKKIIIFLFHRKLTILGIFLVGINVLYILSEYLDRLSGGDKIVWLFFLLLVVPVSILNIVFIVGAILFQIKHLQFAPSKYLLVIVVFSLITALLTGSYLL